MGKLLFVNTNRTNGIFGVLICAALVAAGVGLGLEHNYPGILLVPAGLFGGKFCLKLATMRSELYEKGFINASCFGSVSARYADLQSISRYGVRVNGVLNTHVYFVTKSGERVVIARESIRQDDKMIQLVSHACGSLASAWMNTLEHQNEVVWIADKTGPILRLRKDGVVFKGKMGADEFIPLNDLQLKPGPLTLVDVCRGDAKVVRLNYADRNFFVGETLVAMLREKQRNPTATPSLEPGKRVMSAGASK